MAQINMNDYYVAKGEVTSLEDEEDGVEQATVTDINRADASAETRFVTVQSSAPGSPADMEPWVDTSTLAGAPTRRPRFYNGASGEWYGTPWHWSAAPPTTTETGLSWYDMTLLMPRLYRNSAYERDAISAFHPMEAGFEVWLNGAGTNVAAGDVLVALTIATAERRFKQPTAVKDASVVGVAMEAITDGSSGVIATLAGGRTVDVNVDASTHAIAIGDYLVTNAASSGVARSIGASVPSSIPTQGQAAYGVPFGAFAIAKEALASGTGTVKAQLLPSVGTGRWARFPFLSLMNGGDTGFAQADFGDEAYGSWHEVDLTSPPSGTSIFSTTSTKHDPIIGFDAIVSIGQTESLVSGPYAYWQSSTDQSVVNHQYASRYADYGGNPGTSVTGHSASGFIPTAAGSGSATTPGNLFSWRGYIDKVNVGTATLHSSSFVAAVGYLY